ncbi:octaprenyl diphosphate synthase [Thiohalobacter sp. IOR34]|uniref:octaprenyl diphosphate synthase n=1 Tax=Thiohalobacter sp. IOR34 TaxID=3057176 RepID=UPI0025B15488|nr:octaprenyl diphosphate synthase [Thiohalobacter sp. IOR34]WJW75107.1 octaprenyl diphosphate synthase [Thiohalobacter sp. IOR34]
MSLDEIRDLTASDMEAVNRLIQERLRSDVLLINQLGLYIINSGGKRLRPLLVLLAANACGYRGTHHINLAAIVEFIHTATLLHDDVVDASELRRGRDTANAIWGNEASVLVGDFLYSRAFEMMVEVGSMPIMEVMAHTTNTIAEGEVMQLLNCNDPDTTEGRYMEVIRSKTAKLFEAAARIGAMLGGQPPAVETALSHYGMHLGTAFQLVDDVLDYSADAEAIGKNIGDDLAEGKPTLPLIHVLRTGSEAEKAVVREAIEKGGRDLIEPVQAAIESTGAIAYTAQSARTAANQAMEALTQLPASPYRDALYALADFSVSRSY